MQGSSDHVSGPGTLGRQSCGFKRVLQLEVKGADEQGQAQEGGLGGNQSFGVLHHSGKAFYVRRVERLVTESTMVNILQD